jgi:phage/plasmid primase-like uncharacterized protein
MNAVLEFAGAMRARGIIPPDNIIVDGAIHRCDAEGKNGKDDASYVFHDDEFPAGAFCNWRDGMGWESWCANVGRKFTAAEREAFKARQEAQKIQREAEEAKRREEARERIKAIRELVRPASPGHPYLKRKGIKPFALGQFTGQLTLAGVDCHGALVARYGESCVQFLTDKEKRFLGPASGAYYAIGKPNGAVIICEGVATGHSLHEATGHAVAVAGSAGNLEAVGAALRAKLPDARLIFAADDDRERAANTGIVKASEAARAVGGLVAIPGEPGDFNDLHQTRGLEAVRKAIEGAQPPEISDAQPAQENRPGAILAGSQGKRARSPEWPEHLAEEAYYGLAGEIVRAIEPHTESDPAAILIQTLAAFGALVGRGPHVPVEGDQHHGNLFALITGRSSKARKGTSLGRVRSLFAPIEGWPKNVEGLSSGEGLKFAVRDPVRKLEKDKAGFVTEVETDAGVTDKRILVVESEFAQVLRQCARPGNTLSATIRSAWDSGNLQTLTRNDPITATGAHVCLIGHITAEELRAELTATDSANGFANRFILMAAERSKRLPFGGDDLDPDVRADLTSRLARAAGAAKQRGVMRLTSAARDAWEAAYAVLSEGQSGLLGAVTARAEAQTLRLALLYALMDEAREIDRPHLFAALAVWERAEASARFVFGSALGDRIADAILRALRAAQGGMTRTQISGLFHKNETAERIGAGLALLESTGLAHSRKADGPGRHAEIWEAA